MKVPKDVICGVCKKVFCCAECRYKHEIKTHAIVIKKPKAQKPTATNSTESTAQVDEVKKHEISQIYLFCPLCERKPMPLQREMYAEMLAHVEEFHLPLRCRKCTKVYNRIDDLQNFSKCTHTINPVCCYPEQGWCNQFDQTCDTVTTQKDLAKVTISTQTSPLRRNNDEFHETPMSIINLRWKAKGKLTQEEFVYDSVSSLKNISSISSGSLRRSLDAMLKPKGQLVRTTSTPVHAELLCTKHTERTFNASGGQVSSIYHSGGETDNHSPALATGATATSNAAGQSPSKQHLESINRYLKVGGPRGKMSAVTPLRQVMSKSIQKAFAEHGGLPSTRASGTDLPKLRKKMFDSHATESSCSSVGSPLDLRMSPVVRRTHSEVQTSQHQVYNVSEEKKPTTSTARNVCHEVVRSAQRLTTTESIVITRTKHLTSLESAEGNISEANSSNASKTSDKLTASSTNSSSSSGVSSNSGSSIYKTCESIEIITATTAMSELQQDYYAVADKRDKSVERFVPAMANVAQVVNYSLPPITPITRIPGALINKKIIRFDSPCEEEEEEVEELKSSTDQEEDKENIKPLENHTTPIKSTIPHASPKWVQNNTANAGSKAIEEKVTETPRSTNSSISDAFFTPSATPLPRSKRVAYPEGSLKPHKFIEPTASRAPLLSKIDRRAAFDRSETVTDSDIENDVVHHGGTPKHQDNRNISTGLGRSWSFGALLGSVMRLRTGKGPAVEKTETQGSKDCHSNSVIKRCASIAGSLIRTQSLADEDEQMHNQKRKRSYTTDTKTGANQTRHYSDPLSPTMENTLRTKRFRIQGRKPIDRMRREF
ncbi:mitosis initiation protein fs(1)Ya [Ceratitis capitata]|uniref:mitosis initiation protein fs(1)Ya n=1 Tax=Ceratitis capitata TaxID=7213 RepID=UPI000329D0A6|nr:mitosis initiation protein fs(1)Ya [Ceratitis capitata]